jgi:hypothetical protein
MGLTTVTESRNWDKPHEIMLDLEGLLTVVIILSTSNVLQLSISNNAVMDTSWAFQSVFSKNSEYTPWDFVFSSSHDNKFAIGYLSLSKVQISGDGARSISAFAPLIILSSLKTLIAMGFEERRKDAWSWSASTFGVPHSSGVKTLEFYGGEIHIDALRVMVEACRTLVAFAFEFCQMEHDDCDTTPSELACQILMLTSSCYFHTKRHYSPST